MAEQNQRPGGSRGKSGSSRRSLRSRSGKMNQENREDEYFTKRNDHGRKQSRRDFSGGRRGDEDIL